MASSLQSAINSLATYFPATESQTRYSEIYEENCHTIYGNIKRIHLERAVVQLPATEKLIFLMHDVDGYEHSRIARLLGLTEEESRLGLHQARVQIRALIAQM